jgi:hypothetical protein
VLRAMIVGSLWSIPFESVPGLNGSVSQGMVAHASLRYFPALQT